MHGMEMVGSTVNLETQATAVSTIAVVQLPWWLNWAAVWPECNWDSSFGSAPHDLDMQAQLPHTLTQLTNTPHTHIPTPRLSPLARRYYQLLSTLPRVWWTTLSFTQAEPQHELKAMDYQSYSMDFQSYCQVLIKILTTKKPVCMTHLSAY